MSNNPFVPAWLDDAKLDPIDFRVLCNLWRRCNLTTKRCNPGIGRIAADCCISVSSVTRALRRLKKRGLIRWETGGPNKSNAYGLIAPMVSRGTSLVSHGPKPMVCETIGVWSQGPTKVPREGTKEGTNKGTNREPPEPPATVCCLSNGDLGRTSEPPSPPPNAAPPPAPVQWSYAEMEAIYAAKQRLKDYRARSGFIAQNQ